MCTLATFKTNINVVRVHVTGNLAKDTYVSWFDVNYYILWPVRLLLFFLKYARELHIKNKAVGLDPPPYSHIHTHLSYTTRLISYPCQKVDQQPKDRSSRIGWTRARRLDNPRAKTNACKIITPTALF